MKHQKQIIISLNTKTNRLFLRSQESDAISTSVDITPVWEFFKDVRGNVTPLDMAIDFHDIYEKLAPDFGYDTRKDTKLFDKDTPNGRLMVAVCEQIINKYLK